MRKFTLFILTLFMAYSAAYYTTGKKNGHKFFDFNLPDIKFNNADILEKPTSVIVKEESSETGIKDSEFTENTSDEFKDAVKLFDEEKYLDAKNKFLVLLLKSENKAEILTYIARCYYKKNNISLAKIYFNKSINQYPNYSGAYFHRAIALYDEGKYDEAITDLYSASELDKDNVLIYYNLSKCYEAKENYEIAIQTAKQAIEIDSTYFNAYFQVGMMSFQVKKYQESINYFRKSKELDPNDKYSYVNIGVAYDNMEKYDSAEYHFNLTIQKFPDYYFPYNKLGAIYSERKEYKKALYNFNKCIKLRPKYTIAIWNRGDMFFAQKKYNLAILDYQKVYEIKPAKFNTLYQIGECYEKLGNKSQAVAYYTKFMGLAKKGNDYYDAVLIALKRLQ